MKSLRLGKKWIFSVLVSACLYAGGMNYSEAAPTISAIADQTTTINTPTVPFYFTIGSQYNPVDMCIDITWATSNPAVIPHAGIASGFTDDAHHEIRQMVIFPATGQLGASNITVTVRDACGDGSTASSTFKVTVQSSASVPHPADSNSDYLMALNEATFYGACWKKAPDTSGGCPADATIDYAVRAGTLWNATANGQYRYNAAATCPLCWEIKP